MSAETGLHVLLSREEISAVVKRLASKIERDYPDNNLLVIGVLRGSVIFLADLVRNLNIPVEIDFIGLSSYGAGTESSGKIRVKHGLSSRIRGRDVLVVEDIVDTGLTTNFLIDYLRKKKPASLKLCALTDKPLRRVIPINIDYLGFTVPNKFLVGYGLDWNQKYRNLPDICYIEGSDVNRTG